MGEEKEYKYNGRIWQSHPTTCGADSFFHAVFGEDQPSLDSDANFRRNCFLNFHTYMADRDKPENLKVFVEKLLETKQSEKDYNSRYNAYIQALSTSQRGVLIKEIPVIAALHNVRVVVFVDSNEMPEIFHPEEDLLGNYPWKVKEELEEAVVHFNENNYTRLKFARYEEIPADSLWADSSLTENEEDTTFHPETYPKLPGSAGIRGILYQIDLLTIFLLNGTKRFDSFWLSTENKKAGKFDDVVLETPSKRAFFLQAKHKLNRMVYINNFFTTSDDDDFSLCKYYLSFQEFKDNFNVDVLYLCTNTDTVLSKGCSYVNKRRFAEDDLLYVQDMDSCYYEFNEDVIPIFRDKAVEYKQKNLPKRPFDEDVFSDDRIKNFFSKFRMVGKYPATGNLGVVIEDMLCQAGHCNRLQTKTCAKYLNDRMLEWFDGKKGRYLNQNTLRIFLSEFRSNSFCEKLYNFQIHLEGEHFSYLRGKRLVHIEFRGSYVLNMVKVYYSLYMSRKRYLFISPVEDVNAQVETVRAFEDSQYEVLAACFKVPDAVASEIATKLTDILDGFYYKRIILITGKSDRLAGLLKVKNESEYEEVFENITFNDLTEDSQHRLLSRVTHFFDKSI